MRARLPGHVEVAAATRAGRSFAAGLSIADTRRLQPMVESARGPIYTAYRFYRGSSGEHLFQLAIRGEFLLTCQRCCEPMAWPVERQVCFQAVASNALAARIDEALEPCVMDAAGCVDPKRVAEDELILSLPLVARHERACAGDREARQSGRDGAPAHSHGGPFEILRNLKR